MPSSTEIVSEEKNDIDETITDAVVNNDTNNKKDDAADETVNNDNGDDKPCAPETIDNNEEQMMEIDQKDKITVASTTQNIDKQNDNDDINSNKHIANAKVGSGASAASIVETMIYEETMRQIEYAWEAQRRIARRCVSKDEILRKMKS